MATEVWNLGVEGVSEQWHTISEGSQSTGSGTTPEDKVCQVRHVWCKRSLGHFVGRASDVLKVSKISWVGLKKSLQRHK